MCSHCQLAIYTIHLGYRNEFVILEFIRELPMMISKKHTPKYGIWALALQYKTLSGILRLVSVTIGITVMP